MKERTEWRVMRINHQDRTRVYECDDEGDARKQFDYWNQNPDCWKSLVIIKRVLKDEVVACSSQPTVTEYVPK